jgi:threonine/homoserine/homoserine lactone efflux protein
MALASLLIFATAYLAVVILPGAAVTALVARVLARGPSGAPAFTAGIALGSLIWFTVAATGLAAIAASFAEVLTAIRYAGAAYLLYLAWKLWHAPVHPAEGGDHIPDGAPRLFLAGLAVQLGNPKAVVFFLALLPTVVNLEALTLAGYSELCMAIILVVTLVFGVYTTAAARARRFLISPRALRAVNRGSSVVMAGAAAAIATR